MSPPASADATLGVLATSRKPDERRLPIHPRHLDRIDPALRARMLLELGYGERFGVADTDLEAMVGGIRTHEEVMATADIVLLPKPTKEDVVQLRSGQVLWGWPHLVQDPELTQLAIDNRLTVIAWEAMNHWSASGDFNVHVFHKNNELAGYCSVLHALTLTGMTGHYGRPLRAAVISFGATGRGAVTVLSALGIRDVTVLTQREATAVAAPVPTARFVQLQRSEGDPGRADVCPRPGTDVPIAAFLRDFDLVVNCIYQDTDAPLMFVTAAELAGFPPGSLLVDVSCDEGMGFEWAHPTTFRAPIRGVGDGVRYYAVDHSPSYLWDAATWEISEALLPFLPCVMGGPAGWDSDETVAKAIEVRNGVVQNRKILSFQDRTEEYPHVRR